MDDTFVIQQAEQCHQFVQHINSLDLHIQYSTEDLKEGGSIPFLDTLVSLGPQKTPLKLKLSQTNPQRPLPTLGQQLLPHSQTQHI